MGDRIRIKDIAARAGVSVGTVDRVLHKRPNVSKSALEKVEKVLKEINYQPNVYASALAYNKSYTLYCILPKHTSEAYWQEIEIGAIKAVEFRRDFHLNIKLRRFSRLQPESFGRKARWSYIGTNNIRGYKGFYRRTSQAQYPVCIVRFVYARLEPTVVLWTGFVSKWLFCCKDADADCTKRKVDNADEANL